MFILQLNLASSDSRMLGSQVVITSQVIDKDWTAAIGNVQKQLRIT